jgi:hypothetical protein
MYRAEWKKRFYAWLDKYVRGFNKLLSTPEGWDAIIGNLTGRQFNAAVRSLHFAGPGINGFRELKSQNYKSLLSAVRPVRLSSGDKERFYNDFRREMLGSGHFDAIDKLEVGEECMLGLDFIRSINGFLIKSALGFSFVGITNVLGLEIMKLEFS